MPRKQSLASRILAIATSAGTNGITSSEIIQALPDHPSLAVRHSIRDLLGSRRLRSTNRSRRSVARTCMFNMVYELAEVTAEMPVTHASSTATAVRRGRPTEAVRQKRIRDAIALLKKAGIKKVA